MMDKDEEMLLRQTVAVYGDTAQVDMLIEEMGEVLQAIMKLRRANKPSVDYFTRVDNLHEELADLRRTHYGTILLQLKS